MPGELILKPLREADRGRGSESANGSISNLFAITTYPSQPSIKVAICTKNGTVLHVRTDISLDVVFFRTESGNEPVREWLRGLSKAEKRVIGNDIKTVQYGWPMGMPVVRKLEAGLWEVRSRLDQRISRILFTVTR